MKHALQYNFIPLFIQEWITTDYSCIKNTILLSKTQFNASLVWEGVHKNGTRWTRQQGYAHYAEGRGMKPDDTMTYFLNNSQALPF